jgi:sulfatase maturation enzyme AslB (radical SAM superfamily)
MSKIFNPSDKILCHLGTVEKFLSEEKYDPITVEIDPSNSCNHSCPFCISGHLHLQKFKGTELFNRTMLDKTTFEKLIKDLVKTKIKAINWTGGGEPTQNPFLGEAIKFINENSKIEMGMFTNGSLLERFNLFEVIVKSLKWIRISIDAGKADTYDNLRKTNKNNNFDQVMKNINKLIEYKKNFKSDLIIGVGFVVTKENYKEIKKFSEIFKNIDVDYCQFKPEIIQIERHNYKNESTNNNKMQISSDFWLHKVIDLLDEAKEILNSKFECNSYKLDDLIVDVKNYGRNYKECIGSQFQPCIGADGHVYVCTNHRGHKKYSYGNIYESNFSEIWNNLEKRREIMNNINKKEKFCNCTQLCKPHESNKILWSIKTNMKDKNYINNLKDKTKKLSKTLKHINFI